MLEAWKMSFVKDLCVVLLLHLSRTFGTVDGTSMSFPAAEGATAVHLHISDSPLAYGPEWKEDKKTSLTLGLDDVLLSTPGSLLTSSAVTTSPPSVNASTATLISGSGTRQPCYFPSEYRGIYQVQSATDAEGRVQYDQVEIGPQEISVWGTCHSFTGQHVLLHISTESGDCFRCFHVVMRTATILQVNTEGLEKCYTNEATARLKCPSPATIKAGDGIFLWRKSGSIEGNAGPALSSTGQNIYRTLCPLDGEFTFRYYVNGSPLCETGNTPVSNLDEGQDAGATHAISRRNTPNDGANDPQHPLSTISNCPSRDTLHATFRSCQFTDRETTFKCLGTWPGEDGQTYIGLMDFYDDSYAKYRCALFKEEKKDTTIGGVATTTSILHVSLSPDSTCSNELYNASSGFETLELYPISQFNKRKIKSKIRDLKRKLTMENTVAAAEETHSDVTRKPLGRLLFAGSKSGAILRPFRKNTPDGADALDENVTCKFADWMQGNWQHFTVKEDDLFLKELPSDTTLFDGYPMGKQQQMCVGRDIKVPGQDEKILVYSTTSCGEEYVSCMWVRKADHGTMEYRRGLSIPVNDITLLKRQTLGEISGQTSTFPPFEICEDSFFQGSPWVTQMSLDQPQRAEVSVQKTASCPFLGELEAELGRGEKCAAFSSHCGTSDVFEYKIRSCKHPTSGRHPSRSPLTYDERHFRCISSWNDDGYNIFLTERLRGEEVNQINGPLGSTVRRQTRNSSTTDNIETQCFVMKASVHDSSYVIASLSSNCERLSMGSSWEGFLAQNGLRFRLTANCSSALFDHATQANKTEVTSNEIPRSMHRSSRLQNTNTSDISFNEIVSGKITSGFGRTSSTSVIHCMAFVTAILLILTSRSL